MNFNIGDTVKIKDKYVKYMYEHLYKLWYSTDNMEYLFTATFIEHRDVFYIKDIAWNPITHHNSVFLMGMSVPVDETMIELLIEINNIYNLLKVNFDIVFLVEFVIY